ncbi:MAG TPA: asparagine synthase (glutamine-hydrolyzing), partial [Candidatus Polarisedimenticolia bacterium]|nr:asparagine synthase (glutamine-hydrolyzing) [Candidatus Polarisedimenticolia bacterium]
MCGIAGIVSLEGRHPAPAETLRAMVGRLTHRGPDAEGFHATRGVHVGVRRLAVIDLETGNQPIYNEAGSAAIVFNGEIYNFMALRSELQAKGHHFRTSTDTEVIVHLYEEEGLDAFGRLNGMFAVAIHDLKRRSVVVARDPHGMKPLYWTRDALGVRFASEAKAIFADSLVPRRPDLEALVIYLSHWYVPTPRSAFEGIRKLRPGHLLLLGEDGSIDERPYSRAARTPGPQVRDLDEAREVVLPALTDAVRRQLVADVPVGIFLSGGIDSSLIGFLAARLAHKRLRAFTVSFDQHPSYDEAPAARAVASAAGLEHTVLRCPDDPGGVARDALSVFDEPFGDFSSVATLLLCREARRYATVCLTGDGGDEAFAGYQHYFAPRYAALYQRLPRPARAALARLVEVLPSSFEWIPFEYKARRFIRGAAMPPLEAQLLYKSVFVGQERDDVLGPLLKEVAPRDPMEGMREALAMAGSDSPSPLHQLLVLERATFMLDDDLVKVDRTSMASSLEARLPMLDDAVVEAAQAIPERLLLQGGSTKAALRAVARGILPRQVARMKKKGFTPPMSHWLAGPLGVLIDEFIPEEKVVKAGLLRPAVVARLVSEHRS